MLHGSPASPYACEVHEEQPYKFDLVARKNIVLLLISAMVAWHWTPLIVRTSGVMHRLLLDCTEATTVCQTPLRPDLSQRPGKEWGD